MMTLHEVLRAFRKDPELSLVELRNRLAEDTNRRPHAQRLVMFLKSQGVDLSSRPGQSYGGIPGPPVNYYDRDLVQGAIDDIQPEEKPQPPPMPRRLTLTLLPEQYRRLEEKAKAQGAHPLALALKFIIVGLE